MIFYFTGTGNSKYIAEQMAIRTHDTAYAIVSFDDFKAIEKAAFLGFVFPVYAWAVPEPIRLFIKQIPKTNAFSYAIATCGEEAGLALLQFNQHYALDSQYSLVMPNNYLLFAKVESQDLILEKFKVANDLMDEMAKEVLLKQAVHRIHMGRFKRLKTYVIGRLFNQFGRATKPFHITSACNGCGFCVEICPSKTIELEDGKPFWHKHCYQCLGCLNRCPEEAIQYGKKTKGKDRYRIETYLD